ncbi:MAG: zinc-dependent peptidase, partial [Planctomycetes bacterium]|nr:zinc-dependent peptidase [Planctomycetota bacterium]
KRWEAARGFELTDEIVAVIASQAALLVLELAPDAYRNVGSIIVHPTTVVATGQRSVAPGLVTDEPMELLGQAVHDGPVLIVWDAVLAAARHPERGHNVVFHEFAHKLDMLSGTSDGTPPLATREELAAWVRVCTDAYRRVVAGGGPEVGERPVLRPYAGVNPAEFFAVATEAFFDVPRALVDHEPSLYRVLSCFYRQDPVARLHGGR